VVSIHRPAVYESFLWNGNLPYAILEGQRGIT
jgi:hypothetical protein